MAMKILRHNSGVPEQLRSTRDTNDVLLHESIRRDSRFAEFALVFHSLTFSNPYFFYCKIKFAFRATEYSEVHLRYKSVVLRNYATSLSALSWFLFPLVVLRSSENKSEFTRLNLSHWPLYECLRFSPVLANILFLLHRFNLWWIKLNYSRYWHLELDFLIL